MNHVHWMVSDLLSSRESIVAGGVKAPALQRLLALAESQPLAQDSLEGGLCDAFGVPGLASVTLLADGVAADKCYWMRADPVHLLVTHNQALLQAGIALSMEEASQLCASLNEHFAADGLHFVAPHPQRWYLRLQHAPKISTRNLPEVIGQDIFPCLPVGEDAARWHRLLNEIQMLLHTHPASQAIEARGELPPNSLWLWGGGFASEEKLRPYDLVQGDGELAIAFADMAGIPYVELEKRGVIGQGRMLIVSEGLRLALQHNDIYAWRESIEAMDKIIHRLLADLRFGKMEKITLDALQANASQRFVLTRGAAFRFWRRGRPLERYVR